MIDHNFKKVITLGLSSFDYYKPWTKLIVNKLNYTCSIPYCFESEAFGVFQMIYETTGCGYDNVRLLGQGYRLSHHVHTTHNNGAFNTDDRAESFELLGYLIG